jgi:tRNA threonylcarbamoyladenosine biosynthesis protein TsaE
VLDCTPITLESGSEDETRALGARLGRLLARGDIVLLSGPLGSGKTRFAQGIAAALGVSGRVASPTFVLINEYRGTMPLFHADLYRLEAVDVTDLALDELAASGVLVVEWPERANDWTDAAVRVEFEPGPADEARSIELSASNERGSEIIAEMTAA